MGWTQQSYSYHYESPKTIGGKFSGEPTVRMDIATFRRLKVEFLLIRTRYNLHNSEKEFNGHCKIAEILRFNTEMLHRIIGKIVMQDWQIGNAQETFVDISMVLPFFSGSYLFRHELHHHNTYQFNDWIISDIHYVKQILYRPSLFYTYKL